MKKNDIKDYYANVYDEEHRLSCGCDNRHLIERIVKMYHYKGILKFIPKGMRILDISCGTGLYSIELAKMGYSVYACDLCENHIYKLKEKSKKLNLDIHAYVCDARSLPFEDDCFDFVLLAGAIYHLPKDGKIKAISEAVRVCRPQKHIMIDYLPRMHAEYQNIARYGELISKEDEIFSYDNTSDMFGYIENIGVGVNDCLSTDGITRLISEKVNSMSKEQFDRYVSFCIKQSFDSNIVDMGEHAIIDIIKN